MASLVGDSFFGLDLGKIKTSFSQFRRRISKRVLLIEFGTSSVNFAELKVHDGSITLDHIRRYPLPEDAIERGIPTDPSEMAALIRGHCEDEDIPAHRAAVVIPPDTTFTTLLQLPEAIDPAEAVAYAMDPASSVQVPIQLDQTDADLIPMDLPQVSAGLRCYFLTAVPRKLIDRVIETINLAGLELLKLQIGTFAQLNQLRDLMAGLSLGEVILHVELLRECSMVSLVTASGPIRLVRLTAIREFPEPEAGSADVEPNQPVSTERQIVASDRYLPLSELDIRRLSQELRQTIQESEAQYPWIRWQQVVLAGPNSAHPLLASLLQESLGLAVELSRPLAVDGVSNVELKQPILMQRLGRLVGMGLSFLEQPADPKSVNRSALTQQVAGSVDDASAAPLEPAVAAVETIEPRETLESLDLITVEPASQSDQIGLAAEPAFSSADSLLEMAEAPPLPGPQVETIAGPDASEVSASGLDMPLFSFDQEGAAVETDSSGVDQVLIPMVEDPAVEIPEQRVEPSAYSGEAEQDSSPFSMGDLLSSFEARVAIEPDQVMPEPVVLESILSEVEPGPNLEEAPVHLLDDPSLWPSVARDASSDHSSEELD